MQTGLQVRSMLGPYQNAGPAAWFVTHKACSSASAVSQTRLYTQASPRAWHNRLTLVLSVIMLFSRKWTAPSELHSWALDCSRAASVTPHSVIMIVRTLASKLEDVRGCMPAEATPQHNRAMTAT